MNNISLMNMHERGSLLDHSKLFLWITNAFLAALLLTYLSFNIFISPLLMSFLDWIIFDVFACCHLERVGAEVVECACVIELPELKVCILWIL